MYLFLRLLEKKKKLLEKHKNYDDKMNSNNFD